MPVLFVSYRRSDSQDVTGRIYDRLVGKLSPNKVFKDVDNIPLGVTFPMHIRQMLTKANVVLVIIGPTWVTATNEDGQRRLNDPDDFVRQEVEQALRANIPVIPVLVSNARMPRAEELPPSLKSLAARNGLAVRPDPDFNNDMQRLFSGIDHLDRLLRPGTGKSTAPTEPAPITVVPIKEAILVAVPTVELPPKRKAPKNQSPPRGANATSKLRQSPEYPSRRAANILVVLMLFGLAVFFALLFLFEMDVAKKLGMPAAKNLQAERRANAPLNPNANGKAVGTVPITIQVAVSMFPQKLTDTTTVTIDGITKQAVLVQAKQDNIWLYFKVKGPGTYRYSIQKELGSGKLAIQHFGEGQISVTEDSTFVIESTSGQV